MTQSQAWDQLSQRLESPPAIRATLRRLGIRPRKGLGQHFLIDEDVLARTLQAADLDPASLVVEVGPGLGTLTQGLAQAAARVVAVEVDPTLAHALQKQMAGTANVQVVNQDALRFDPGQHFGAQPYKVVANLPYYITSPILRHFLEEVARPKVMVLMMQREVAERIAARPGEMALLSVSVQFYGEPRLVAVVPPTAFYPAPEVDSAIVRIDVYDHPPLDVEPETFFRLVRAGFSQPRKQLHNSLAERLWFPPGGPTEALRAADIDPKRRPQTLSLDEWAELWRILRVLGYLKPSA